MIFVIVHSVCTFVRLRESIASLLRLIFIRLRRPSMHFTHIAIDAFFIGTDDENHKIIANKILISGNTWILRPDEIYSFVFTTCAQSIPFISGLSPRNDFARSIRVTKSNKIPSTDSTNLWVASGFLSSLSLNSKKSAFARNGYFDKTDNLAFDLPY